jgi:hypothetical protein
MPDMQASSLMEDEVMDNDFDEVYAIPLARVRARIAKNAKLIEESFAYLTPDAGECELTSAYVLLLAEV